MTRADRIERLVCALPEVAGAQGFLDDLAALLALAQGARRDPNALEAHALAPPGARPRVALELVSARTAALRAEPALAAGELEIAGDDATSGARAPLAPRASVPLGPISLAPLPAREVARRLAGRVRAFDHLALNLPAARISEAAWSARLAALGEACNLYRYDDATAFAIPATDEEARAELDLARPARKPKLELVRDARLARPRLELALDTDLEPAELVELFPPPEGAPKPGAETFFHAVALAHPWPDLDLSLDLGFRAGADFDLTALVATPERRVRGAAGRGPPGPGSAARGRAR